MNIIDGKRSKLSSLWPLLCQSLWKRCGGRGRPIRGYSAFLKYLPLTCPNKIKEFSHSLFSQWIYLLGSAKFRKAFFELLISRRNDFPPSCPTKIKEIFQSINSRRNSLALPCGQKIKEISAAIISRILLSAKKMKKQFRSVDLIPAKLTPSQVRRIIRGIKNFRHPGLRVAVAA